MDTRDELAADAQILDALDKDSEAHRRLQESLERRTMQFLDDEAVRDAQRREQEAHQVKRSVDLQKRHERRHRLVVRARWAGIVLTLAGVGLSWLLVPLLGVLLTAVVLCGLCAAGAYMSNHRNWG